MVDGESCCDECVCSGCTSWICTLRNGSLQLQCITSVYLFGYKLTIIVKIHTYISNTVFVSVTLVWQEVSTSKIAMNMIITYYGPHNFIKYSL